MNVTVISDASRCHETGLGGYAFWIACSRGKKSGEGIFKKPLQDINVGETMAMLNALQHGINSGHIVKGDSVLMQTDSQTAIHMLMGRKTIKKGIERTLVSWYLDKILQFDLTVSFKHVKGHTRVQDSRSKANRRCDQRARRMMKQARSQLQQELAI